MTDPKELPPLPEPEITSWYGPSSEFYQEQMFTTDQMREYAQAAVAQERERCAKLCDEISRAWDGQIDGVWSAGDCAAAIRKQT